MSDETMDAAERLLNEGRKLLAQMQAASRFSSAIRPDGTCPIFYDDTVVHIALPWGDFDTHQMQLIARHAPRDDVFLRQLFDLVPSLEGRAFIDVGSYTGTTAMITRAMLNPRETHLFEPQKTMKTALDITVTVNDADDDTTLHTDVVDEAGQEMTIGNYRADRLSDVSYLRRADGAMKAVALDDLGIDGVGLINLDYNNAKLPALRGAAGIIERDRPVITLDMSARDIEELREFIAPFDYEDVRAGQNSVLFLPK